jgi:hypothetical protein
LIEDQKGLVGVQVRQVGEWVGIRRLPPSQNAQAVAKRLVWGRAGVSWGG